MGVEDKIINDFFDLECPHADIVYSKLEFFNGAIDLECELKPVKESNLSGVRLHGVCSCNDYSKCMYFKEELYSMIK